MKTILTALGLILVCHTVNAVTVVGGPLFNPANGHSYLVLSPATWTDAESFSQSLGGHLLTINNAAENDWVYANILSGHPDLNAWTGLNDIGSPGIWHWISGEPVTFLNFAPGEPSLTELVHPLTASTSSRTIRIPPSPGNGMTRHSMMSSRPLQRCPNLPWGRSDCWLSA